LPSIDPRPQRRAQERRRFKQERIRRKLTDATDGDRQMVDILAAVLSDGLAAVALLWTLAPEEAHSRFSRIPARAE
jgi:hypothetical protein